MARIELNIVALGDFSSVTSQIKSLQLQVDALNKGVAGVGLGPQLAKDLNSAQAAFKSTMLSTGQFTMQTVAMRSETEKFGASLVAGKLKLSDYFNIITGKAGQAKVSMDALAESQIKLQNSVVVKNKQGFLDVYTPTSFNKVAQAEELVTMKAALMQKAINGGSTALLNFGKNTQWAGRQLTVGLTMPMVMFGAAAVKSFKDTNTELTRLQRLYGEGLTPPSQAQINQISSQVLNLGKQVAQQMGIAQTETVKVAANFAAMGRQGKDLLDITYQTQRLSKLGAVDATQATNTIVALQNVYKVSTNDLAGAVNFLSDIQKQTTMTLGDMTEAIPRVGPIMKELGGTYKETAVMLVAMREAGIPASQAANALKSAMASIIAPTSAATKEFATFGINLTALKSAGGPVQMIESLQASLAKLTPLARETLIEKLFGKMQYGRISALLDNFGKAGSQTINALKIAGATSSQLATLANQEMKQATGSISAQWTRTLESFKATLYPIGQKFVEMGTIVLGVANKIGNAFSKLPSPIKGFFGFLVIGAALAGPLIMLTGLLANFASYLLRGIGLIQKLATGGMTIKELLTPEIMASQKAAELFSDKMANDVDAVDLLNQAVERLTTSLASMSNAMSTGTADVALSNAASIAQANVNGGSGNYNVLAANNRSKPGKIIPSGTQLPGMLNPYMPTKPGAKFGFASGPTTVYGANIEGYSINEINSAMGPNGVGIEAGVLKKSMQQYALMLGREENNFQTDMNIFTESLQKVKNDEQQMLIKDEDAEKILERTNLNYARMLDEAAAKGQKINDESTLFFDAQAEAIASLEELKVANAEIVRKYYQEYLLTTSKIQAVNPLTGAIVTSGGKRRTAKTSGYDGYEPATFREPLSTVQGGQAFHVASTTFQKDGLLIDEALAKDITEGSPVVEKAFAKNAELAGTTYVASLQEQINKTLGVGLSESAIKSAEASASVFKEGGALSGTNWYSGFISRAKTSMGMGTGTLGKGGGMGIAMAGTMAGMSMSSSKNSTVNTLGTGITAGANAAMLASFLPMELSVPVIGEIMAGVTAAAIGIKMLIKHMDDVKAHNAEVAASFKSSSDVISAYGGTMLTATQAVYNFNSANKESSTVLSQTAKDVAEINKLKPTDSLRQIGDLLKGGTSAKGVIGTVEQYAAAQVAAGMDPKAVSQMVTDLLTYSGQTQYLSAALKEITTNTQDMTTATTTWLNKLKNNGDANIITAKSYKDMSTEQKAYADGLLLQTNIISAQNTPFQTVIDKLKALSASSDSSGVAVGNFALALKNSGADAASVAEAYNLVAMGITNMGTAAAVYMLNAAGFKVDSKTAAGLTQQMKTAIPAYILTQQKKAEDAAKAKLATDIAQKNKDEKALNAANSTAAQLSKKQKDAVDALGKAEADSYFKAQSKVKVLDAQLTVQKQITSELQAQQQYQLSQAQIDSQIRTAVASGDFMQASLLRQQKSANTVKYNGDTSTQQMQNQVDALKEQIATDDVLIAARQSIVTGSSSGLSGDIATIALDQASLDVIKKAGSNTNIITQINELFKSSGLDFKAFFDKNNVMHVEIDKSIPLTVGSSQAPLGATNNAIPFDQNTYKKTLDALTNKNQQEYGQSLKNWNASTYGGADTTRQGVKAFANAKGVKDGQSFSITQNGKVYEFIMGKDPVTGVGTSGNVTMVSDQGKPGQTWNGSSWISPTKKAIGGHIFGPGTATSDSIPAMLSNGEYVIKADSVSHYGKGFFDSVNAKHFAKGGYTGPGDPVTVAAYGIKKFWDYINKTTLAKVTTKDPKTGKWVSQVPLGASDAPFGLGGIGAFTNSVGEVKSLFLGMPRGVKALEEARKSENIMQEIHAAIQASDFKSLPITKLGEQLEATVGKSFPVSGIGGLYKNANGTKEFVKPVTDALSGLSEIRSNQIARDVQGLDTPIQELIKIMDPSDPKGKRTLLALRSAFNPEFANPTGKFTKDQYFRQLVSSLLRGDKDLQVANLSGNNLVDAGTSGVFNLASGIRTLSKSMPSMQEQATINLLGVKGGAKRFFAESTASIAKSMTPKEYHDAILTEIKREIPLLEKTIASFKLTDPDEIEGYANMLERLKAGAKPGVDWSSFQAMAASVVPASPKTLTAAALAKKAEELTLKKRQSGHAVGFSDILFKDQLGGYANGGHIFGPGTATSDSIPAYLSNGEFIHNAASVKKYGVSFMNAINAGSYNPSFPNVGPMTNSAVSGTMGGSVVYNINVSAGSNASADDIAKVVMDTIKRNTGMTNTNRRVSV